MFAKPTALKKFSQGFSLIELIVVLLIMTTVMAVAAPRFSGRSEAAKLQAVAADLQALAIAARAKAILRNQTVNLFYDRNDRSFLLRTTSTSPESDADSEPQLLLRRRPLAVEYRVQIKNISDKKENSINFFPNGSASAGEIIIDSEAAGSVVLDVFAPAAQLRFRDAG